MRSGTSGKVAEPPPPIPIPGASVIIEHDGQLRECVCACVCVYVLQCGFGLTANDASRHVILKTDNGLNNLSSECINL